MPCSCNPLMLAMPCSGVPLNARWVWLLDRCGHQVDPADLVVGSVVGIVTRGPEVLHHGDHFLEPLQALFAGYVKAFIPEVPTSPAIAHIQAPSTQQVHGGGVLC